MPNHEELYSYLEKKYGKKTDALAAPTDENKVVDTDDALLERMRLSSSLRDMSMGTQMRNIHDTVENAITSNPTHLYNYLTTDDDNTEKPSQVRGKALAEKIQPAYDSVKGEDKDFVASKYATADKLIDDLYATAEDGTIEIDGYKYPKATVSNVMRGIVENTMHPQLFATNKDYRSNYFLSNFGKDEQSYYTDRLETLDKELNDLLQMMRNEASSEAQSMTSVANKFGYSNIATPAVQFGLQESMGANVVRDAIDKINSLKKGTLWAGVNEGFDWVSALSMGLNDIASSVSLSKILNKITEDEPLSPREELAFKAYTLSKEVDSIGNIVGRNRWNDIGQSLGKISEFALPMAAPVKLATTGVKMTSLGVKEALATTIAVGKKSIPTAIGRGILETAKVGGRLGANVARAEIAGAMLAPFTPITWANFAEKRLQQYSVNNDGEIEFKPSKLWKDIVDVEIEQANEIASEIFGLPLQKVIGNSAKTFGRLLRLDVVADKVGLGADKRFIFGLRKPAAVREFERSLGFAGLFGDGSSEILGEYLSESMKSVITGNGDVSRLNNSEFWGNTLLISALYGGSLSIATLPLSIEEYKRSNIYQASKSRGVALSRIEDRELRNKMLTISSIDDIDVAAKELAQLDWSAMPRKDIAAAMDFVRADYMEKVLLGDAKENMRMNAYTGVALNTAQYVYRGEDGSTPTDDIISIDTEDGRYMVISGVLDNASDSELICRDANGKIVPIHASKIQGIYKHSLQEELGEQYKQQFGVQIEMDRQQEVIEKLNAIDNPTKNDITSVMSSFGVAEHQSGDNVTLVDGRSGMVDSLEDDGNYIVRVVDNQGEQYLSVPFYDILADDATMAEAQQMNYMQRSVSNLDEYSQKVKETAPEERNGIAIGDIVSAADGRRGRVLSFNEDGTITIDENMSNTSGNLDDAYIANVAESDITKEDIVPQTEPNATETPTHEAKEVTEEVAPEPAIAEIKPIPTKEDGSVDYDAIDDPAMFAEQFSKDMGGAEEASVQVSKMFWATQKEIEKLMAKREALTDANEVVSNRKAVNALNNKLQLYREVIKELNPKPKAGIIENEYSLQLDSKFKKFINTMAETFGLSVEFVEGIKGNAQIDGNKVKIAWEHRDKGIKFLIGHEFTHRMQDLSPEQYAKFKASVKEFMGEDAWNEQMARMKQTYIYNNVRFDVTLLEDEVVADFVGALVEQADAFDRYINSVEDKGILATIAKVLRSIRDFIFNAEAEAAKPLTEMLDKLDTLIESSEVAQSETQEMEHLGEKQTATTDNTHFSLPTINGLNDALNSYNATSDIASFVSAVRAVNDKFGNHHYITNVIMDYEEDGNADEFVEKIKSVIGENTEDYAPYTVGGVRYSLSDTQVTSIIEAMKANAEVAPQLELTPENWVAEFGTEGIVATPIGEVIMGEHQYKKLVDNKRSNDFGKVKPTLTNPDIVLEEYDPEEGALRDTKFLFIKAFAKPNGEKIIYFTSVTVKQKSGEVSISSHRIKNEKKVKEKMHNDNVMHLKETLLDSEVRLTKPQSEGSDLVPTPSVISKSKDTTSIPENQTNVGKFSLITPEMDASYLDAVERGDMETAQKLVMEAAKLAMPNTKVVDEDGNPKVVYHGTPNYFNAFSKEMFGTSTDRGIWGNGFYFSEDGGYAKQYQKRNGADGRTLSLFLSLKNPLFISLKDGGNEGAMYFHQLNEKYFTDDIFEDAAKVDENMKKAQQQLSDNLIADGYDGVVIEYSHPTIAQEYVAFEPNQIKSADPVTYDDAGNVIPLSERFNPKKEDIRYSIRTSPTFYSNAQYAVQNIKQEKATPEQWLKMIEKNGGLKAGEDKWLGLSDWFKASDKKTLTKDEVLQYIAENDIQIEEVSYGEPEYLSENEIYESDAFSNLVSSLTDYDEDDNPYINQERYKELQNADPDFLDGFSLDYWGEGLDIDNKMAAARYLGLLGVDNEINNTRLQYTTQGLTKKKEIALVVPTIEPYNQRDEIHFGDAGEGRAVAWVRFGDAEAQRSEEVVRRVDEFETPYKDVNGHEIYRPKDRLYAKDFISYGKLKSGEYAYVVYVNDKQIPVAHKSLEDARNALNEHYKANPEKRTRWDKVLVIDEIQSKRHQDGREKGYSDRSVSQQELYEAQEAAFSKVIEYESALADKYGEDEWAALATAEEMAEYERLRALDEAAINAYENYDKGVPSAPFEKNWAELAFKRMLRYAAENGYDYVAWTTGDQQADRYDIGSVVKDIVAYDTKDADGNPIKKMKFRMNNMGTYNIATNMEGVIVKGDGEMKEGMRLSDITGKALAEKIMNGEGEDAMVFENGKDIEAKSLEGEELHIGNEGMKAFYDQMLPSFVKKYTKKWGAEVGEVTMPDLEENNTMHAVNVTDSMRESVMQGQPKFSLPSLVGVHNISLDKLRKVIKMGGLANPSVAVIDVDKQTHDDYGEYSLVLPKNMVDARQGKNAGTWAGDAWTPTYPQVVKRMNDDKAISRFYKDIDALPEAMRSRVRLDFNSFMEGRSANALAYWYLFEKGNAPEMVLVPSRYSDDVTNAVSEATNGSFSMYGLTPEERAKCLDAYIAVEFDGDRAAFETEMQERIERLTETIETKKSDRVKKWAQDTIDSINEYGFDYDAVAKFIRDVEYDAREKGTVNVDATITAARELVEANNLEADYDAWRNNLDERYGIEEYIFDGYTNNGDRRYLPHTVENASKWMKKQGRQGAVATFPSFGTFVAVSIPKMTTLESIRKRKALLGKSKEEYDAFREKWENVYYELGKKLMPDAKGFDDYGYWRLIEAVGHKNPKEFVKKEYNIELSEEDMAQLNDMLNAIRTEYPARYFETKFERPLQLSDFVAAVVPNDMPMDVYGRLKEANVGIFEYEKGNNNSRAEAMRKASEVENVRFSLQDVEAQRFNRKVEFIKGLVRNYNVPNPLFIAETKEEFVQMVKEYDGEVDEFTPDTYGYYCPDDDIILLNGGMLITSGDAHRSTMHEYAHSITRKYLGERLAEVTASILETEIDKARKEMLPEAYNDYSYPEIIDEFTSLLLEDLTIAETHAIFEGEMAIDTFVEKLKKDINAIEKISNKDVLYAVIPLVVENLKIQKEQYGKDREHTIVIPRVDSRRNPTFSKTSHLSGDKKSRPIEAESRVYETGRGGEGSQEEVNSRYALLSAPITEEEQIRIYLRQKHLKNKEDIRKKYRAYRSAARMHYEEERAKRSAALKDMRSYAAKVEYILGDQVEQTIPLEHQALAKIARGEIKMPWKALSKELGLKKGEKRYYSGIIKDADPNVTFNSVVHQWWTELGGYTKDIDDQDLRNALIDALSTATSSSRALSVLREIYDKDIQIKDDALDAADLMENEELAAEDARYAEEEERFNANKDTAVEEFVRTSSFYNQIEVVDATVMQIRERLEKTQMALTHRQQMRYYQGVMETIAELKQAVKDVVLSKTIEVLDRNALRSVIDKIDKARSVSEIDGVLAEIEEISLNAGIKTKIKDMGRMLQLRLPNGVSVEEWVDTQVKEGRLSRADGDAILRDKWKGRNAKGVSVAKKVDVTTAAIFQKLSELIYPILAIKGKQRVSDDAVSNNNAIIDQLRDDKIGAEHGVAGVTFTEAKEIELQARILYDKFLQTEMLKSDADECMDTRSEIEQHYYGVAGKEAVREKYLTANRKALNEINRQRKEAIDEFNETLLSLMGSGRDALTMYRREQEAHKSMVVNMALDALGVGNRLVSNPPTAMEKVGAFTRSVPNAPYYTFQTTLREIDRLAPNGEGRFYNYLMSAWTESNNNFITQHNSHIEEVADALSRILGVKGANNADIIMNMIELSDDKPLLTVHYGGEEAISKATPESKVLTLSNALYVIAMWRQARYRASMEYHGFTQQMYNAVYDAVVSENEKYITFIDWVNNELLPDTRLIYDKVHREMFGASMANERNYFPARLVDPQKAEDISLNDVGALPSTMTGAIVNRINNKNMVNLNMNYFKVLMSHLQEMDQWSTFAPLIRDLNAIVSDKTFKKSCNTLKPGIKADRSGAGSLFTIFKTVSAIAVNCYRPSHQNNVEDFLIAMTRGWAGSNIAFRFSTALKQLASSPVFAVYATDPKCLSIWAKNSAKTFAHQRQTLEWAKANSPMFKKRWESKFAGMDIFESKVREGNEGVYNAVKSSKVGKGVRAIDDAITKFATEYGMTPNAFIDAMTVANGIRTVYEYEVYLAEKRNGGKPATEEQKRKALVKAEIAFNESQQSSESAFVSQWQSNRTFVTRALATYQNSAYGFHRLRIAAANEYWKQAFNEDYRNRLVDTYGPEQAKKMLEDARKKAMAQLLQGTVGDMIFVLMGAAGTVPLFTYLGGDDDEGEAWDLLKTAMVNMALNVTTGGYALGSLLNSGLFGYNMSLDTAWENLVTQWNVLWDYDVLSWPFAYQALNIVAVNRYGVDFDTLANIVTGIEGIIDGESSVEGVMKVLNIPQSQINLVAGKRREGESIQEYVARRLRIESIGAIPYIDESGKVRANQGYWQSPFTPRKSYVAKYKGEYEDAYRRATLTKIGGNDEYRDFVKTEEEYKDVVKALGWAVDTKPNNNAYIDGVYSVPPIDGLSKEDYNALWKLAYEAAHAAKDEEEFVGTEDRYYDKLKMMTEKRQKLIDRYNEL